MHKEKVKYYRARSNCRLLRPNASRGESPLFLLRSVSPPPVATGVKRNPRRSPGSNVTCARNSLSVLSSVSIRNNLPPLSFGSCKNSNTTYKIQQYE
ncbi:hypothetical protein TNCT_274851 [Trichonephila clavata]|uniref:Uncharacterized protein n=1 Tax=Trichonephila clavata TaxID=2740835 RepID=A0A8X6G4A2_TRICU|nr:hypothetical protein TNCT_274851 [Trichonephila clavata]